MAPFAQKRVLAHERPENKMGRPTEYRPEYCDLVIEKMSEGISLSAFAGVIKVAKSSVYLWMSEHSDFSHAVKRAQSARLLFLERKMLAARYGAQAVTSIFALKNADPHEWRDMRQVQHDHNVALTTMSDEQLLAIAQGHGQAPMIDVSPSKKQK